MGRLNKIEMMENMHGCYLFEIVILFTIPLISFSLFTILQKELVERKLDNYVFLTILDFFFNGMTCLLVLTIMSDLKEWLLLAIVIVFTILYLTIIISTKKKGVDPNKKYNDNGKKKQFISNFKGFLMINTLLGILGIDFQMFPRRFAKVQIWGTSIMDMGVGSFTFSLGIVRKSRSEKLKKSRFLYNLFTTLSKMKILLISGFLRVLLINKMNIYMHINEYGVHWNFFFTTVLVILYDVVIETFFSQVLGFVHFLVLALIKELILKLGGLENYILNENNRYDNIISMNKEGIVSLSGFIGIFCYGKSIANLLSVTDGKQFNILTGKITDKKQYGKYKKRTFLDFFNVTTFTGLLTCFSFTFTIYIFTCISNIFHVSRRMTNLAYVMQCCSMNTLLLCFFYLAEKFLTHFKFDFRSNIYNNINDNGMLVFLIGNLLTGLTNLLIETHECNNIISFGILTIYLCVLVGSAHFLKNQKVVHKIKPQ